MTIKELQDKYLSIYNSFKNVGFKNKIILIFMSIPATVYLYTTLEGKYYKHHWNQFMPHNRIVIITIGIGIAMILIILTIKSFSFIYTRKANTYKFNFKQELFDCLKTEIPEISDYFHSQKIHPKVFNNSHLFKTRYSDYIGDDWILGRIDNIAFEICELHVFTLFRNIFSGIFIRIITNDVSINIIDEIAQNNLPISDFELKYKAKILASQNQNEIFLAIKMKGKFLEADNPRTLKSTDENVIMLKKIVDLIKKITEGKT